MPHRLTKALCDSLLINYMLIKLIWGYVPNHLLTMKTIHFPWLIIKPGRPLQPAGRWHWWSTVHWGGYSIVSRASTKLVSNIAYNPFFFFFWWSNNRKRGLQIFLQKDSLELYFFPMGKPKFKVVLVKSKALFCCDFYDDAYTQVRKTIAYEWNTTFALHNTLLKLLC